MGWIALGVIAIGAFGALTLLGVPRLLWSFVGAVLMLGAAGYALQGHPTLPGKPVSASRVELPDDDAMIDLRTQVFGRFGSDGAYLVAADGLTRTGNARAAIQAILGGLRGNPRSVMLWTSLGTAFAHHDGNQLSPPALFAFRHAARLAPSDPGPLVFLGVAYVRSGDLRSARRLWTRALALTPSDAPYRRQIAEMVTLANYVLRTREGPQQR